MRISDWSSDVCSSDLRNGSAHAQYPFVVDRDVKPLVGHRRAAKDGVDAQGFAVAADALHPPCRSPRHVVHPASPATETDLAIVELGQVVRRSHAACIEEIFILADAQGAGVVTLTHRSYAVGCHLGLIHRDGPDDKIGRESCRERVWQYV